MSILSKDDDVKNIFIKGHTGGVFKNITSTKHSLGKNLVTNVDNAAINTKKALNVLKSKTGNAAINTKKALNVLKSKTDNAAINTNKALNVLKSNTGNVTKKLHALKNNTGKVGKKSLKVLKSKTDNAAINTKKALKVLKSKTGNVTKKLHALKNNTGNAANKSLKVLKFNTGLVKNKFSNIKQRLIDTSDSLPNDNESMTIDDESMTIDDESMTIDDESITISVGIIGMVIFLFYFLEIQNVMYQAWTNKRIVAMDDPSIMIAIVMFVIISLIGFYMLTSSNDANATSTTRTILSGVLVVIVVEHFSKILYFFRRYKGDHDGLVDDDANRNDKNLDNSIATLSSPDTFFGTSCINNKDILPNNIGFYHNGKCTTMNQSNAIVHIKDSPEKYKKNSRRLTIDVTNNTVSSDKYKTQYNMTAIQALAVCVAYVVLLLFG